MTFGVLVVLGAAIVAAVLWSAVALLLAGAPTLAAGGGWPGISCVLLPTAGDYAPHLASYAFLAAIVVGLAAAASTLLRQQRRTRALVCSCLVAGTVAPGALAAAIRRAGLTGRVDLVDVAAPLAFCYGLRRPRVLVSTGLDALLTAEEAEALLLHEAAHVRGRDPLKVAVGRLLCGALGFVPAVAALYRRYLVEKELAADRAAVAAHGTDAALASALVKLLDARPAGLPGLAVGGGTALDARVAALLGEPMPRAARSGWRTIPPSAALVLLAVLPALSASLPASATASQHNVVAVCHLSGVPGPGAV